MSAFQNNAPCSVLTMLLTSKCCLFVRQLAEEGGCLSSAALCSVVQEIPELPCSSPLAVSPTSALSSRPINFCAGEVPTASQGLLKLFRRNSEELSGPKGVNSILT